MRPFTFKQCDELYHFHSKGAFIVYCNAAAVPMYRLHTSAAATQCTVKIKLKLINFAAVPLCSSRRRDGISGTATATQLAAVHYEHSLNINYFNFSDCLLFFPL